MGLRSFIRSARRVLMLAVKPTRKEFLLLVKFCLLVATLIGAIAYVIRLISVMIG
ncbi:TPA: protein translocase SEC61 complex subunit gamma [Candidatus Bathyarchaeota archaeon]|nr:protein translocase SEC61 complex subunit gamma [Candidatus Bathyarchaeota archaeon]